MIEFKIGDLVQWESEKPFIVREIADDGYDVWLRYTEGFIRGKLASHCKRIKEYKESAKDYNLRCFKYDVDMDFLAGDANNNLSTEDLL